MPTICSSVSPKSSKSAAFTSSIEYAFSLGTKISEPFPISVAFKMKSNASFIEMLNLVIDESVIVNFSLFFI